MNLKFLTSLEHELAPGAGRSIHPPHIDWIADASAIRFIPFRRVLHLHVDVAAIATTPGTWPSSTACRSTASMADVSAACCPHPEKTSAARAAITTDRVEIVMDPPFEFSE
jgi:hypothetical protein